MQIECQCGHCQEREGHLRSFASITLEHDGDRVNIHTFDPNTHANASVVVNLSDLLDLLEKITE